MDQRVFLRPGERKTVWFTLQPGQFSPVTADGKHLAEPAS
jgi:hypothetical protein